MVYTRTAPRSSEGIDLITIVSMVTLVLPHALPRGLIISIVFFYFPRIHGAQKQGEGEEKPPTRTDALLTFRITFFSQ